MFRTTEFVLNPEINSYAVVQVGGYQLVKYEYDGVLNDNYASSMNSVDVQYDTGVECRGILVPLKGRGKKEFIGMAKYHRSNVYPFKIRCLKFVYNFTFASTWVF